MAVDVDSSFVCQDFVDSQDGIDSDKAIRVISQSVELLNIVSLLLKSGLVHVVELDAANNCGFLDVGVLVLKADVNSLLHVFKDTIKLETAQRSECEASNLSINNFHIHEESVDGKNSKLLVLLSIISQVEIDHFLHHDIVCSRCLDHLGV